MICPCCDFQSAADRQFTAKKAAKQLRDYRRGRIVSTTRLLRDGVAKTGLNQGSLLDVGGGVGALAFELLDRGMRTAIVVEASSAYVAAATEEAARRGRTGSIEIVHGDFLEMSDRLPTASVVTLDRVVCCYPFFEPMLEEAVRHAERAFAFSYPKDRWYVRAAVWLDNKKRARKTAFRTYVHPPLRMLRIIQSAGFELASRRSTATWSVDVFVKSTLNQFLAGLGSEADDHQRSRKGHRGSEQIGAARTLSFDNP